MGNDFDKKYKKEKSKPYPKPPTMMEVKTYIMVIQNKLTLFRNKKVLSIKKKRQEIVTEWEQAPEYTQDYTNQQDSDVETNTYIETRKCSMFTRK